METDRLDLFAAHKFSANHKAQLINDTTQRWAKVPSQELSDFIVDALKKKEGEK